MSKTKPFGLRWRFTYYTDNRRRNEPAIGMRYWRYLSFEDRDLRNSFLKVIDSMRHGLTIRMEIQTRDSSKDPWVATGS